MKYTIALGADHAGFLTKSDVVNYLNASGYRVIDMGTHSEESVDYPEIAARVGKAVAGGHADRGLLFCGTGLGMEIAANKVKKIRAAAVWSVKVAKLTAEHNWCNVLCLPCRFATSKQIKKMILAWLNTPFDKGARHERRVKKILKIEAKA